MAGKTGSGKSTLARHLLSTRDFVIVIDTKRDNDWRGFRIAESVDQCFTLSQKKPSKAKWIFRPSFGKERLELNQLFERAYEGKGWHVYVDEGFQIGDLGNIHSFPPFYVRSLTAGRSRQVTVWTSTQRPVFIPKFALTEDYHYFIFELGSLQDRKALVKTIGIDGLDKPVSGHRFIYYNRGSKRITEMEL